MSKITSMFEVYDLSEEDQLNGSVLSPVQLQVMHNLRTSVVMEKLALEFDTELPMQFAQAEASLKGQLDSYNHMIESHYAAMEEIKLRLAPDANIST